MGLFDFIKEAGEKVFGGGEPEAVPEKREVDLARLQQLKRNKALQDLVARYGLEVEGLRVEVEGELATVSGKVDSQVEREKVILAVGNVVGIARVDDRLESVRDGPEATLHVVKKGESLSRIAQQHYGNAAKYIVIFQANRPMLSDPDKIYPGQTLRIPRIS